MSVGEKKPIVLLIIIFMLIVISHFSIIKAEELSSGHYQLSINIQNVKEVWIQNEQGDTILKLEEVNDKQSGDILRYIVRCQNTGNKKILDAFVICPIPFGTIYLPEVEMQDSPVEILFSFDGGINYYPAPIKVLILDKLGAKVETEISPLFYTHLKLRFKKPLLPLEKREHYFKVKAL